MEVKRLIDGIQENEQAQREQADNGKQSILGNGWAAGDHGHVRQNIILGAALSIREDKGLSRSPAHL
jgi:hypothetical protein